MYFDFLHNGGTYQKAVPTGPLPPPASGHPGPLLRGSPCAHRLQQSHAVLNCLITYRLSMTSFSREDAHHLASEPSSGILISIKKCCWTRVWGSQGLPTPKAAHSAQAQLRAENCPCSPKLLSSRLVELPRISHRLSHGGPSAMWSHLSCLPGSLLPYTGLIHSHMISWHHLRGPTSWIILCCQFLFVRTKQIIHLMWHHF